MTTDLDIDLAAILLDAHPYEGGAVWAYEPVLAPGRVYLASADRMGELQRAILDDQADDEDRTGRLLAAMLTDEHCTLADVRDAAVVDDPDLDALGAEAGAAGDTLTAAAIFLLS